MRRLPLLAAAFGLLAAGVFWNVQTFDRRSAILKQIEPELVVLPKPDVVKHIALGFNSVLADLYWIGAVHYLGERKYQDYYYSQLIDYIDIIVALAPDLREAYWFGGVAAPWNTGEKWVNVEGAVRTLEAGIEHFPNDWRMRMVLAYDYAAYQKRFKDAGDQLRAAVVLPGAPSYLASLATRMYVTAGDVEGATLIAQKIFESSEDESIKAAMAERTRQLETLREVEALKGKVQEYKARSGRLPERLEDLGLGPLKDSFGDSYLYDPKTGEVRSKNLNQHLGVFGMD